MEELVGVMLLKAAIRIQVLCGRGSVAVGRGLGGVAVVGRPPYRWV